MFLLVLCLLITATPIGVSDKYSRSYHQEVKVVMNTSWYGPGFHGRMTASGAIFDQGKSTAAHKTLGFGTILILTNPANGKIALARVTDRGPYILGRDLDVSWRVADMLGMIETGVTYLHVYIVGGHD